MSNLIRPNIMMQTGAYSTVEIGEVETLPAGSQATVENVGTPIAAVLNFGIPAGPQGESGPEGPEGPQGVVKVFTLSDLTDYETAAEAIEEVTAHGTAIIRYGASSQKYNYIYQNWYGLHPAGRYMFVADCPTYGRELNSYSELIRKCLMISKSGGAVTGISEIDATAYYLDPTESYVEPFIPTDDGHPATKKYVDGKIGSGTYRIAIIDEEDEDNAGFVMSKVRAGNEVIVTHDYEYQGHTHTAFYRLTDYRYDISERRLWFSTDAAAADVSDIEIKQIPDAWETEITFYYIR